MCGIYGVIDRKVDRELAMKCLNTMIHRGPDGYGLWQEGGVTLGHRRLSILDLSSAGSQPMSYANERYWMTFNGEIYNFIEIRKELEQKGYTFRGNSDSEVIMAAYCEWKDKCVERFNGMWTFAIWDKVEESLFISRDRFGVKPLFYAELPGGGVAFASEMKAIIPMLEQVEANKEMIDRYFTNNHYENQEECLIRGIKRFPAGFNAWYRGGKFTLERYWNTLDHLIEMPERYEEQVEQFRELFLDACKIRMRSDVTLGTGLSGGLDSSATICAMAHISKNSADERVNKDWQHAYVACFPGTDLDETKYAKAVTDYLGIKHTFMNIDSAISESEFLRQLYCFEELWGNTQVPMMELYKKEREFGTTVSLDGHAADELFAGYGFDILKAYPDAKTKEDIDMITTAYLNQNSEEGIPVGSAEFKRQKNKLYRQYMLKYRAKKLLGREDVRSAYSDHPNWNRLDNLNKTLFVSTHETILPTLLRNYDRDSMASSVEIRMPFLDYRIVQMAFSIGWKSKLHGGWSKSIVRDACAGFMPEEVCYRRTKLGFNAPILDWMRGPYRQFFEDTVNSAAFANCALINQPDVIREDLRKFLSSEGGTFSEAADIWNRIQPYLWEKALIKHDFA